MKKFIALLLVMVTLVALFASTACQKKEQFMVIGMPVPMSGAGAYIGMSPRLFLEDYCETLNASGGLLGKKLKIVAYDTAADVTVEAVNATNRLISQDKAFAIIGPTSSGAAIPMAPVVNAAKIPVITPTATNEKVTVKENGELNPYMFRVCFIDNYQGKAAAYYAYEKLGYRRIGVFDTVGDPYTQGICDYFILEFERLGGTITQRMSLQSEDVEFRPQLTAMAATNIEAIFSPASSYVMTSYMMNQAAELGIKAPFIMSDASYDDALLDVCGNNADGAMLTNGLFADDPAYAQFAADYKKKHPEWSSNYFVLYTYDCVELLVWAVKKANSFDGEKIKNAIESADNIKLFTDPSFSMDPKTHNPLNKTITVITVENGKWKLKDSFRPQ